MTSLPPLRVFVSAGEPSGDLHASRLISELKSRADVDVDAIGGRHMEEAGARIVYPMEKLSVVGLSEVLLKLPALYQARRKLRRLWARRPPGLFVPVDFPGFNLRLAGRARSMGVPVMYYIAPQIWAWGEGRIGTIRRVVDRMAVVLPFEEEYFRRRGVAAEYVGHPLVDLVGRKVDKAEFRERWGFDVGGPLLALLPGSRWQEVSRLLPPMLEAFKNLKKRRVECRAAIGLADGIPGEKVSRLAREVGLNAPVIAGRTRELIGASDAVLAASGTVTLEAALLEKPMAVMYKLSRLTYAVAKRIVRTESIGLVNLVAGKRVVPEYVQDEISPPALAGEVESMLFNVERREAMIKELRAVKERLGGPGASARAAEIALATAGWARE